MLTAPRTWRRATLGALAATVLLALPAGAHPFVRGGEAPVDSVTTVELAMGHGCGTEDSGGGDPTLEVALEIPDELRVVEVAEDPAYVHAFEVDDGGRIEVITWTAADEGEPAPDVEFDAVFTGEVGDEVYLRVFQGCEDFAYRWIGTPDEPADDPAVRVTLVAADPDAPAPAPDETTPAEAEAAPEPPAGTDGTDADDDGDGGDAVDEAGGAADETDEADEADADEVQEAEDEAIALEADDAATEDDGGLPLLALVVLVVVLAGLGALLVRRGGRARGPGGLADPADDAP
jgi:uncharacterized protein YcnI